LFQLKTHGSSCMEGQPPCRSTDHLAHNTEKKSGTARRPSLPSSHPPILPSSHPPILPSFHRSILPSESRTPTSSLPASQPSGLRSFTTSTGHRACSTTRSAVLPSSNRLIALKPWEPIITRSTSGSLAIDTISSRGYPTRK